MDVFISILNFCHFYFRPRVNTLRLFGPCTTVCKRCETGRSNRASAGHYTGRWSARREQNGMLANCCFVYTLRRCSASHIVRCRQILFCFGFFFSILDSIGDWRMAFCCGSLPYVCFVVFVRSGIWPNRLCSFEF